MLADRICVMRSGEILQIGRPNDIYYRPADAFVAGFIGDTNLLPIEVLSVDGWSTRYKASVFTSGLWYSLAVKQACSESATRPARVILVMDLIVVR